jgi:hypothetical protein
MNHGWVEEHAKERLNKLTSAFLFKIDLYSHTHVFGGGDVCWGTVIFLKMIGLILTG